MSLENLKVSDDRSQELAKKMKEVKVLDEATSVETTDLAKNAIASLDNAKLALFIETQFKLGDKWKPFAELTADPMYVFAIQSSLDALGYDELLTGGDTAFGIDERYWSRTRDAVKKFQEDMWLTGDDIDGLVWEKTFALMSQKLRSIPPVFVNKTDNPKFWPVASPFIDGEVSSVPDDIDTKKPLYTSLDRFLDDPTVKLPLYKSDVLVDYNGKKVPIWFVVLKMFGTWWTTTTEKVAMSYYDKYKNHIVGDPILSAYILYRSMKWIGTHNNIVDKVMSDNKNKLPEIFNAFGVVGNQDLVDYLVGDFGGSYSDYLDRSALQKYITLFWNSSSDLRKIIAAKSDLRDKNLYSQFVAYASKYPEWASIA